MVIFCTFTLPMVCTKLEPDIMGPFLDILMLSIRLFLVKRTGGLDTWKYVLENFFFLFRDLNVGVSHCEVVYSIYTICFNFQKTLYFVLMKPKGINEIFSVNTTTLELKNLIRIDETTVNLNKGLLFVDGDFMCVLSSPKEVSHLCRETDQVLCTVSPGGAVMFSM